MTPVGQPEGGWVWHRAGDHLLYTLYQDSWYRGQPKMVNRITVMVQSDSRAEGADEDRKALIDHLQAYLSAVPKLGGPEEDGSSGADRAARSSGSPDAPTLTCDELNTAEELLADPDSEDCERFASRYGSALIAIARSVRPIPEKATSVPSLPDAWRPIETAPKDGTPVDLWAGDKRWPHHFWSNGAWCAHEWRGRTPNAHLVTLVRVSLEPTHWMPFPAPPTDGAGHGTASSYHADAVPGKAPEIIALEAENARLREALTEAAHVFEDLRLFKISAVGPQVRRMLDDIEAFSKKAPDHG